jgi:hypothetical protein
MPAIVLWSRRLVVLVLGAAFLVVSLNSARSQTSIDGPWSVLIITDAGDCDRAYRYGVTIDAEGSFIRAKPGSKSQGA